MRIKILVILALATSLVFAPRPVLAQDGCGLLGFVFGCRYDQRSEQIANEHTQEMAQINAQATAVALAAQQQGQQIEYQRWLATEQAQEQLQRIASQERVSLAEIQTRMEQMRAQERMNAVNATTSFNVAALQSDAMIAVAAARADAARAEQITAGLVALAVIAIACALAYAAWQHRRAAEVQAQPHLLPAGDWQRRAVALLEQKRVPWLLREQQLLAQIDGEWVRIEED